jgi:hypothetical protein
MPLRRNPSGGGGLLQGGIQLGVEGGHPAGGRRHGCLGARAHACAPARREGVRRNFRLVAAAARELGDVPQVLGADDFAEHGPDEKAVLLYVAFLCSRLLEAGKEERAARAVQALWRARQTRAPGDGPCAGELPLGRGSGGDLHVGSQNRSDKPDSQPEGLPCDPCMEADA